MKVIGSNITITDSVVNKMGIVPLGNCEQDSTTGKNKFNINALTDNMQNVTFGNDKLILTGSNDYHGTNVGTNLKDITNLEVGQSYILSFNTTYTGTNANKIFIRGSQTYWQKGDTLTITQEMLDDRIAFYGTNNSEISNIMIRLASVSDTSYEKYTGGIPSPNPSYPQDIKVVTGNNNVVVQNKNLFDGEIEYGSINPADGSLRVDNARTRSKNYIKVKPNTTYTITRTNINSAFLWIVGYNSNKQGITDGLEDQPSGIAQTPSMANSTLTFTTTSQTEYIKWYQTNNGGGLNEHIQIELGSTATTYVPHAEQTYTLHLGTEYLAGIGDYKDKIVGTKDNWKIVRNVGKYVFDGTETYGILAGYDLYCQKSLNNYFNTNENTVISNMLQPSNNAEIWSKRNQTGNNLIGASTDGFRIMMNDYNDGEVLKAEILRLYNVNTPLYAYYRLNTPTEETITDTDLIEQLNNLQDLLSYDGVTNITVTSDNENNAQLEVEVTYTSESDMIDKLLDIFDRIKSKLYHIIRSL